VGTYVSTLQSAEVPKDVNKVMARFAQGQVRGLPLQTLVPQQSTSWAGTGIAFKGRHRQLHCTLLARWETGYKDGVLCTNPRTGALGMSPAPVTMSVML